MLDARIEAKIAYEAMTGCWLWTGYVKPPRRAAGTGGGYGEVRVGHEMRKVHRVVYEALVGPIPAGYVIRHRCFTPSCCQPLHLEAVTNRVNILDVDVKRTGSLTEHVCGHPRVSQWCKPCRAYQQRERRVRLREEAAV